MSYHRRRSIPLSRGFRIRSKSRLPGKGVPSIKVRSSRPKPTRQNSIRYPLQVENEIKFYETESNRFLAAVEIRNLTPFAMIYKLFHSNPALEFTEFIISSPFGSLQFDEAISILVAPARFFSREYLDEAVFELWIAPKATLDKKLEIRSNWPKHVKDHVIMKTVMKTVVLDSQQYIEELLMRGVENDFDSESIMSSVPSLSVYAARAKKREQRKLKKEKPFPKPNEHDLNSSRKVRHFVKQLMEKEKEKERLQYEDKMKQKKPSKHPKLQSSSSQYLPPAPERETLTIYQREIPEESRARRFLSCMLIGAGIIFIVGLLFHVSRKAYRFLLPNLNNDRSSRFFNDYYLIQ